MGQAPERQDPAYLEIHLRDLGYQRPPECQYLGTGVPRDLSILNDDSKTRATFVDRNTIAVYQSHCENEGMSETRQISAFFLDSETGRLTSQKTWPTTKRKWLNERWDTQARIFTVSAGFLVHSKNSLDLYSAEGLKAKLPLAEDYSWAVTIPPLGQTIHLQQIYVDNQADGLWLSAGNLEKIRSQHELAGITSASNSAVVERLAHCLQLQKIGEPARDFVCSGPSHLGYPVFLNDSEILSVYSSGFAIFTTSGEQLWSREGNKGHSIGSHGVSLNGNRFGILVRGKVVFDGLKASRHQWAILVYDRIKRSQIFQSVSGRSNEQEQVEFAISPNGSRLAVVVDDSIRIYKIPE